MFQSQKSYNLPKGLEVEKRTFQPLHISRWTTTAGHIILQSLSRKHKDLGMKHISLNQKAGCVPYGNQTQLNVPAMDGVPTSSLQNSP